MRLNDLLYRINEIGENAFCREFLAKFSLVELPHEVRPWLEKK